mgnify:CR=1 FL=1
MFVVNRWVLIRRQKEVIEEQKEEVESQRDFIEDQKKIVDGKNNEILASIEYAKRIQRAILPPKEIIERRKNCRGPVICIVPQKEGERNVSFVTPRLIGGALVASITSA